MKKEEKEKVIQFMLAQQQERIDKLKILNQSVIKGQILFTGSSLMEQFPINELLMTNNIKKIIYNRGVGGFTTEDMLRNMETMVFAIEPSKIFINIGTNDIASPDYSVGKLLNNYEKILQQIKKRLSKTEVFVMAYYPVNETDKVEDEEMAKIYFANRTNQNILAANREIEKLAIQMGYTFINVNNGLMDDRGKLKKEFTIEGIHMYANAYRIILNNMKDYL